MADSNKYPLLIGSTEVSDEALNSVQEVADFICTEGLEGDVAVYTPEGKLLINTFGIYINQITDMEYREELLKVLIPMQKDLDGTAAIEEGIEVSM